MKTVLMSLIVLLLTSYTQAAKLEHFSKNSFAAVSFCSQCEERMNKLAIYAKLDPENEAICIEKNRKIQLAGSDVQTVDPDKGVDVQTDDPDKGVDVQTDEPDKGTDVKTDYPDEGSDVQTDEPDEGVDVQTVDPDKGVDVKTDYP